MPRRSQAVLGIRLAALLVACTFLSDAVRWAATFFYVAWTHFDRDAAVVGAIHGVLSGIWTMTVGGSSDQGVWIVYLGCGGLCGASAWVVLSPAGVPWFVLRRCPHG
jgi:hypothetical protein